MLNYAFLGRVEPTTTLVLGIPLPLLEKTFSDSELVHFLFVINFYTFFSVDEGAHSARQADGTC